MQGLLLVSVDRFWCSVVGALLCGWGGCAKVDVTWRAALLSEAWQYLLKRIVRCSMSCAVMGVLVRCVLNMWPLGL